MDGHNTVQEKEKKQWYSKAIESIITTLFPACFTICGFLIWHTYVLLREDVDDVAKENIELRKHLQEQQASHSGLREVMMSEIARINVKMTGFDQHIEEMGMSSESAADPDSVKSRLEWKLKERIQTEQRDLSNGAAN